MNPGAIRRVLSDLRHMLDPRPIENPKFSLSELAAARRYYDSHGWVVICSVFSSEEIERFREGVVASRAQRLIGDLRRIRSLPTW